MTSLQPPCRFNDYFSQQKKCHDPLSVYHSHHHHLHHHVPRINAHALAHHNLNHHNVSGSSVTICERDIPLNGIKNGETLQIILKDHPSLSFRNKGHVDIEVRYKPNAAIGKVKPMLEKIVVTDSDKCPGMVQGTPVLTANKSPTKKSFLDKHEKPVRIVFYF